MGEAHSDIQEYVHYLEPPYELIAGKLYLFRKATIN